MKNTGHKYLLQITIFLLLFISLESIVCADTTNDSDEEENNEYILDFEPYTQDNMPEWAHDLRRGEIITLGSLPFTTLTTTFTYSIYRFCINDFDMDYFPNPFPSSSSEASLDSDEQIGIIITAASLSVLIGIADFVICKIKDKKESKQKQTEEIQNGTITITGSNEGYNNE